MYVQWTTMRLALLLLLSSNHHLGPNLISKGVDCNFVYQGFALLQAVALRRPPTIQYLQHAFIHVSTSNKNASIIAVRYGYVSRRCAVLSQ